MRPGFRRSPETVSGRVCQLCGCSSGGPEDLPKFKRVRVLLPFVTDKLMIQTRPAFRVGRQKNSRIISIFPPEVMKFNFCIEPVSMVALMRRLSVVLAKDNTAGFLPVLLAPVRIKKFLYFNTGFNSQYLIAIK